MISAHQKPEARKPERRTALGAGLLASEFRFLMADGFPHSEICGSKVAHTSPQLIAACHVLHRLCMPRHPPNALTSRLRIHITNDNSGTRVVGVSGGRDRGLAGLENRPLHPALGPLEVVLRWEPCPGHSQLDNHCCDRRSERSSARMKRAAEPLSSSPRHRFLEPIHNVKEERRAPISRPKAGTLVFIPGENRGARCPTSLLGASKGILRSSLRERSRMVEPAGIEPATSSLQS